MSSVHIQMMGDFAVYIDNSTIATMSKKSRKGLALVQFLIINHAHPVANYKLLSTFWSEDKSSNPENALKTLVSRTRVILNEMHPGLGECIVADRGAYHWECSENVTVDYIEIEKILEVLLMGNPDTKTRCELMDKLFGLYTSDLLQDAEMNEWVIGYASALHNNYMQAILKHIARLKDEGNYEAIVTTCRAALQIDNFDDRLNMELMTALIKMDRTNEALVQYKHVVHMHYRFLGAQPSEDMKDFYRQIVDAGKSLDESTDRIFMELNDFNDQRGAFICDYAVFREIYHLQMRNFERMGTMMFLVVVMITSVSGDEMDSLTMDNVTKGLLDILIKSLRKGDTITQVSSNLFALLLPTVNYSTGNMVMERIKHTFYLQYPNSDVGLSYRLTPLDPTKVDTIKPER